MTSGATPVIADDGGWPLAMSCARYAAGVAPASDVVAAALRVSDWASALRLARAQGLDALLTRALSEGAAPESIQVVAQGAVAASMARTLGQQRLLVRVLAALRDAGVPALPYKGPALSLELYGDATLRSSVDLDVVVPRASYEDARRALVALGLAPRGGHSVRQERTLFRWVGQASFGRGSEEFVELHWRFAPLQFPFALTPECALARASRDRIAGVDVAMMAADDLAVTLSMHAARHLFERLEWLSGVTRLLLADGVDVGGLVAHAGALRGRRTLLVTAGVAARVLGAPLGARWQRAIDADSDAVRLAETMTAELRRSWAGAPQLAGVALQRRYAELLDTRADRVRSVLRATLLPTQREWEAIRLPDALTPLYHLVRPVRLLAAYARRALSHSAA